MTKALTFIQAYSKFDSNILRDEYHKLVSQEFKLEMIVEYFEGWEEDMWANGGFLYRQGNNYRIYKDRAKEIMRYEIMNQQNTLWIPQVVSIIPRTLDDFIGDSPLYLL